MAVAARPARSASAVPRTMPMSSMAAVSRMTRAITWPAPGAERDADADLVAPLGNEEGKHTVEAHHYEQGGEHAKKAGEHGHHAVADQVVADILLKVGELQNRAWIFAFDGCVERQ